MCQETSPLDLVLFPCLNHFLPEERPLVSQEISSKCDDLDSVVQPTLNWPIQPCFICT